MRLEHHAGRGYAIVVNSDELLIGYCETLDWLEANAKVNCFGSELRKIKDMIDRERRDPGNARWNLQHARRQVPTTD